MSGFAQGFEPIVFLFYSLLDTFLPIIFLGMFIMFLFVAVRYHSKWTNWLEELI